MQANLKTSCFNFSETKTRFFKITYFGPSDLVIKYLKLETIDMIMI